MINPEKLRYQKNAFSFWFCILAIIVNVVGMLLIYTSALVAPNILLGSDVLINIFFMLFIFLASERTKAYHIRWSFVCFGFAGLQIVRIFYVPLHFYLKESINIVTFLNFSYFLIASALLLVGAGVMCYIKSSILNKYLSSLSDEGSLHN